MLYLPLWKVCYFDNKHFHSNFYRCSWQVKASIRSLCLPINLGMKCNAGPALWPCCLMSEYLPIYYAIMLNGDYTVTPDVV